MVTGGCCICNHLIQISKVTRWFYRNQHVYIYTLTFHRVKVTIRYEQKLNTLLSMCYEYVGDAVPMQNGNYLAFICQG